MGAVTILGGLGLLGTEIHSVFETSGMFDAVYVADRPELDVRAPETIRRHLEHTRPEWIVNCAALTDVDGCEKTPEQAFAVNAHGAGNVAEAAAHVGARLIQISTDYVFDGSKRAPYTEEDSPGPLSVYAKSKLDGERQAAARAPHCLIVRSAWLYGSGRSSFVDRMLERASAGSPMSGATDLIGSPTWSRDLAQALLALMRCGADGLFHAVNTGECSRWEEIREIVRLAGMTVPLARARASDYPRPAAIPSYSALSTEKLRRATGHTMRPWQQALSEYVLTRP